MNNQMMFLEGKVQRFLSILNRYRYENVMSDLKLYYCKGEEFQATNLKEVNLTDRWGGYDDYAWIKIDFRLPAEYKDHPYKLGLFNFGVTSGGNNSAFEALCFLDGKIYQGVDSNHQEVFLPQNCMEGELRFKLWAGLDGGDKSFGVNLHHEIKQAEFALLDKPVDDLYFLVKAIYQTLERLDKNSKTYNDVAAAVDKAYNALELNNERAIRQNAAQVYAALTSELQSIPDLKQVIIRCVGHTHIDVAWLWRLKHTREKSMRSFSTVLRLMERYPDYQFFQSQPQLYQYIKDDAPELYEEIKAQIKAKRWEPNGAMWVEADCNLTSGESLVRQLLYGKKFFKEEFDITSNCLWLPDVFGYSAALPQILRKSGIDTFMTTKISWNQYNRIPNDTFYWKGIDGSSVLTHFITTPTEPTGNWWYYTYNGEINAGTINGIWDGYRNKSLTNELILSYGFGDGGGGVNREMLEMIDKLSIVPGNNEIKTGFAGEFFDELHEKVADKSVNEWDGELYLEYHRGTYTSQAKTKKYNRKLEILFRNTEITAAILGDGYYPSELLEAEWKKVLTNQFHDILPGSSITEVYEDAEKTYAEVEQTVSSELDSLLGRSVQIKARCWSVMNYTNFETTQLVKIETAEAINFFDKQHNPLRSQATLGGYYVEVKLFPLQTTQIYGEQSNQSVDVQVQGTSINELQSERYHIVWNAHGKLTSIFDKKLNREMLKAGELGNDLMLFEDMPRMYDAWELEPYYEDKPKSVNYLLGVHLVESGELYQAVEFKWAFGQSVLTQTMVLQATTARIDFITHVDWHERNTILRTYFPLNIRTTKATYDIQFGNIERPNHKNTEWDFAKFEVSAHKWADMSQRDCGIALLNDCKYGYNAQGHVLGMSLLKSPVSPDKNADQGEHTFTYSILSHEGDWFDGQVEQEAHCLNTPFVVIEGEIIIDKPFVITSQNLVLDALKRAEDGKGWIVRIHEFAGQDANTVLIPNVAYQSWCETNLMEENLTKFTKDAINLHLTPYEVKTIRLM
ncbi:alpha-mannosidase [Thorsellia anophelis]|uniref:alpha-mannosidase n=1 Tax=Thorsellia anophelis DSM 18579 TaxID=1123402 RepID=A0A1I0E001_9GAMM|nr:alpha-mannosidase [Thorsellia anophelis]SET37913.1 alpha-mannosidase [Thorsellia anophelis DSM 18579]